MHRLTLTVVAALVPALSAAQPFSPTDGKLRVGQKVYVVVDAPCTQEGCGGEFVDGRIVGLRPDMIAVQSEGRRFELPAAEVHRVEKYGDHLWNGLGYGFVFGTTAYFVAFLNDCGSCRNPDYGFLGVASAVLGGSIGAGIGLLSDALISGRTVVFARDTRATIAPIVGRSAAGVRVGVRC